MSTGYIFSQLLTLLPCRAELKEPLFVVVASVIESIPKFFLLLFGVPQLWTLARRKEATTEQTGALKRAVWGGTRKGWLYWAKMVCLLTSRITAQIPTVSSNWWPFSLIAD